MIKALSALIGMGLLAAGCSTDGLAGAGAGVVGAGAAYELNARRQMSSLEEQYKAGQINKQEYEIRKSQIEKGSVVY